MKSENVTDSAENVAIASSTGSWCCMKRLEHWRNRNRVGPGTVKLPDCEFLIVGPRRTLRILRPPLKSGWYYESASESQPRTESLNDNFYARWSRRPHSSGNCRCSFRRSSALSTVEEQIITEEINRIRSSLCESEGGGHSIEELERRVSVNLQKLQVLDLEEKPAEHDAQEVSGQVEDKPGRMTVDDDERTAKTKIVKDLERYINVLLEEILDDTVKLVTRNEKGSPGKGKDFRKNEESCEKTTPTNTWIKTEESLNDRTSDNEGSFDDISFSFHVNNGGTVVNPNEGGYINQAYVGCPDDPDSLDFRLGRELLTETAVEQLDYVDSGINSVETIEFQPDQEPSLEESLIRIIDEKLGRTVLKPDWQHVNDNKEKDESDGIKACEETLSKDAHCDASVENDEHLKACCKQNNSLPCDNKETKNRVGQNLENDESISRIEPSRKNESKTSESDSLHLNSNNSNNTVNDSHEDTTLDLQDTEDTLKRSDFKKLRLEFKDDTKESVSKTKRNTMTKLRKKFSTNFNKPETSKSLSKKKDITRGADVSKVAKSIELEDYRKKWPEVGQQQSPQDLVIRQRNRKPTVIFLHGFGSSAEIFAHQLEYFSALGYPCIAPDMLGHGMSSAPARKRDYHFGKLLRDLDTVVQHYALEPGRKCVLVAHNYGCSFAVALANKYETSIHQLVLISGGGPIPLGAPSTESAGYCWLRAILAPFLVCGLHKDLLYSPIGRQHPYCGVEPPEQWPSQMKYVLDGMVWPEGDSVFHKRIRTPTLLVHGLRDNKVSLVQECQMERAMAKAFLEAIPSAAHTPMTDCPDQLNHMIHCFIDLWKNKK